MRIHVLSSSHKKFSGQVFTLYISHGTAYPFYSSPDFHNHLAVQFSAHNASFIAFYSVNASLNSLSYTLESISSCISPNALFTSSISIVWTHFSILLDFISNKAHTSLILDFYSSDFVIPLFSSSRSHQTHQNLYFIKNKIVSYLFSQV